MSAIGTPEAMHLKHFSLLALTSLATSQSNNTNSTGSLNSTLASQPNLSNITAFLNLNPNLLTQLNSTSNLTILAPSDTAFAKLLNSTADPNANPFNVDPGLLQALLSYHVLNGTYRAADIKNTSSFIPTLLTNSSYSNVTGGQVVEAVTVGNQTVFLWRVIGECHCYAGGWSSNYSLLHPKELTNVMQNVNFTGGVIHIIDSVLTFPLDVLQTALTVNLTATYGAINATNLEEAVNTPDITIFVPTNEAFQSVYSALQNLSDDDLTRILAYHVVNGTVGYSTKLKNGTTLQTAEGANLTVTVVNGTYFVNSAEVLVPNV